jgi:hypothetical protein
VPITATRAGHEAGAVLQASLADGELHADAALLAEPVRSSRPWPYHDQ